MKKIFNKIIKILTFLFGKKITMLEVIQQIKLIIDDKEEIKKIIYSKNKLYNKMTKIIKKYGIDENYLVEMLGGIILTISLKSIDQQSHKKKIYKKNLNKIIDQLIEKGFLILDILLNNILKKNSKGKKQMKITDKIITN